MKSGISNDGTFSKIENIEIPEIFNRRFKTDIEHLNNAFCADGWVPGSTFTINGTPGSGKTTILCQLLQQLSLKGRKVAYISGEESVYQLAYNCRRIGATNFFVANLNNLVTATNAVKEHGFEFIILDSIPCFSMPGMFLTNKEREAAAVELILNTAHQHECVVGCVLHVTKTGTYKGSTLLPHAVDANFSLKRDEEDDTVRILETTKNRFGSCETTKFQMTVNGFDFNPVEPKSTPSNTDNTNTTSILQQRSNKILDHVTMVGYITMEVALLLCEKQQQNAYLALRNCVANNTLIKIGRGTSARWIKK